MKAYPQRLASGPACFAHLPPTSLLPILMPKLTLKPGVKLRKSCRMCILLLSDIGVFYCKYISNYFPLHDLIAHEDVPSLSSGLMSFSGSPPPK